VCQRNCQSFNFAINFKNKEIHLQIHSDIQTFGKYLEIYLESPKSALFRSPNGGFFSIQNLFLHGVVVRHTI
jgi:hypothetical protein